MTLTSQLADFVCNGSVSAAVLERATSALLDTLAVTVAGGRETAVGRLESALESDSENGRRTSPWSGRRYPATDAALVYGTASHVLDYDDVSMLAVCHPSAPVLSALIAASFVAPREAGVSGRALLESLSIGTEVLIRVGEAMGFRHYDLGFHATGTLGVVGAAAAVSRLMRLESAQTAHALAIAASMSAGLRKNFGSMVKSLHVGLAAANGLRAAQLAKAGIEGASEIFESDGFLRAFSGGESDRWPGLALGAPFALETPGFEQKRYPCCYMLHKIIEATLFLKRRSGLSLEQVERARVRLPRGGTRPLIHPDPKSGLHAKFSAPYAVVAALLDGRIELSSFTDEAVMRPAVLARLADVEVGEESAEPATGIDLGRLPASVELQLRDGSLHRHTLMASPGSPEDPLTRDQLRAKWMECFRVGAPQMRDSEARALFREGLECASIQNAQTWLHRVFAF